MKTWGFNNDDLYYLNEGKHAGLHYIFGAHLIKNSINEIVGTQFTCYAPNAKQVFLACSYNNFDGSKNPLNKIGDSGIWTTFIPLNLEWVMYKFEILTNDDERLYKSDPFGYFAEERPGTASKVYDIEGYEWHDQEYMAKKKKSYQEPLLVYEMHLGSWRRRYGAFIKYNELADELIKHLNEQGFTHVEFLPLYEHPLDDSWGYQGTGYFAATSRFGVPKDLMYLIDRLHQAGIGVIIDWVLGHICEDAHGLYKFDGSYLFEFDDKRLRENETWGTANIDFSKGFPKSFMLSALTYWMDFFHIDGFRIDAVANLFYYLGDSSNGTNEEAIAFLKQLSYHLFSKDDRVLLMAEDSTAFPKVTHPVDSGGVGFNYKWNMGFMNDTLDYFKKDPIHRKWHHNNITFGLTYAFSEQFILPFSHDEVVHGKGTLLNKMPGDYFQKFANYRLLLTLFMTHPGKKLLFMGQEFAHFAEWNNNRELDWNLFKFPAHDSANRYFRDLALVYKHHQPLYVLDHDQKTFKWIDADNKDQSIFSYIRYGNNDDHLVIVLNMTPVVYHDYKLGVPNKGYYYEILNSDKDIYYGSNQYNGLPIKTINSPSHGFSNHIKLTIGPLTGIILKYSKNKPNI
ncbi:1,4-alpha-glucan branching protein GlgB [Acholeplasma sp. OttesenSCG-928-E16]|nr:1,4-alpha-glucan branching protein GlgB [Acholeplasma sp. OttesenSCG-928-E16]